MIMNKRGCVMNKQMKRMIGGGVFLILVFLTTAHAQSSNEGERMRHGDWEKERERRFQQMAVELNLTPEQKQQIEAQRQAHRQQLQKLREELRQKKDDLKAELQKPELDMARVQQIHAQIKALLAQKEDQRLQGILQMRNILTPEQFAQFHLKMEESRKNFRDRFRGPEDE